MKYIVAFILIILSSFLFESFDFFKNKESVKTIQFWHYWTAQEKKPLEDLVEKFNSENHSFKVNALSISMPRKKILTAIVGNVAPDLVHLDNDMVVDFALRNALSEIPREEFPQEEFIEVFFEALNINKRQFAIPFMGGAEAMHLNKDLLNKHQIPIPKTLEDIENAFDKTYQNESLALLPSWPSWFGVILPYYFGGDWTDQAGQISANSPENIEAWQWIENKFISKIPQEKILSFSEGFSAYQSPDNPFYSGKIGIEANGIWEYNLAKIYAPKMNIHIAPFPGKIKNASYIRVDSLAIPKNAKYKKEAQEFIQWLYKKENLEYIAIAQKKITPYKNHSEDFFAKHQNPFVNVFIDLAQSPNAHYFPQVTFSNRYRKEIKSAYDKVIRKQKTAKEALDELQVTIENLVQN